MTPRRSLCLLLIVGGLCAASCDSGFFLTTDGAVDDGNLAMAEGRPGEALAHYDEAAQALPESAALHYDRGLALAGLKKWDEATQTLLRALDTPDPDQRFKVRAALGATYAGWGQVLESQPAAAAPTDEGEGIDEPADLALPKWERAVEHLEDALRLKPTAEDVLRNLEAALLRTDPPCSTRDDDLEPNDVAESAALVTLQAEAEAPQSGVDPVSARRDRLSWTRQLHLCPENHDWYAVDLDTGDRLTAKLTTPEGAGAVIMSLYMADGVTVVRAGLGPDGPIPEVTYTHLGRRARFLIRIENVDHDEVSYGLEVTVKLPCVRVEDHLEENDTPGAATPLTPGSIQDLQICPKDEDWFALTLGEGESVFVVASLREDEAEDGPTGEKATEPPFTLDFRDGTGAVVLSEGGPTGPTGRVATLLTPGVGTFLMRMAGDPELESGYGLQVHIVPPCPEGNDRYEDNDIPENATDLAKEMQDLAAEAAGGQQGGAAQGGGGMAPLFARICPGDTDWYAFGITPEQTVVVSVVFEHAKGDLALDLIDGSNGQLVETADASSPEQNGESVTIAPEEPEDDDDPPPAADDDEAEEPEGRPFGLRIRAVAEGGENFYLIRLDAPQPNEGDGESSEDQQEPEDSEDSQDSEDSEDKQEPQDASKDQNQPQDSKEEKTQPAKQTPMEDALDKLDRNPENLEAQQRARTSPLANHPPEKDW